MKAGWKIAPVGELFRTVTGNTPPKSDATSYGSTIPLVKPPELTDSKVYDAEDGLSASGANLAKVAPASSVLVSCIGILGKVGLAARPLAFNQQINAIYPDVAKAIPKFMFWQVLSPQFRTQLLGLASGTTVSIVNKSRFNSIKVSLPALEEQERIVAILDEAFEGLDRARANAEANLQNSRELFEQELTLTFTEGKKGWTNGTVGDLCILKSGTTVDKSLELSSGEIPYIKVAEMNLPDNLDGIRTSIRFLDKKNVSPSQIIPAGSTIFPKRGGAILTNKKRRVLVNICADLNVMSVIPGSGIDSEFLYYFFLSTDMRKLGSGSAIPQINNYDIAPLKMAYPTNLNTQIKVTEELKAFQENCNELSKAYYKQLQNLDDLRQSLLQKAFDGELT